MVYLINIIVMIGFSNLKTIENQEFLSPDVSPDAFAVAPEFDSTEELRVEIDETDEARPVRYTSDVRLLLHTKDLASRAGLTVASKFGQSRNSASQIQQIMDTMSDDDLLSTVRSRHIQSPSEILAWSKELTAHAEVLEREAQSLIDSENVENVEQQVEKVAVANSSASSSSE